MGVEAMVAIGLVWGTTNALIKRGALISEEKDKKRKLSSPTKRRSGWLIDYIEHWISLLCVWQYSIPFLVNLSASAGFFLMLGDTPISLAVPVTNAVTFAATAVAGSVLLGEYMDFKHSLAGLVLIITGIWLCINST
jgi:multidrug transporter EmrE-like cation transporter